MGGLAVFLPLLDNPPPEILATDNRVDASSQHPRPLTWISHMVHVLATLLQNSQQAVDEAEQSSLF